MKVTRRSCRVNIKKQWRRETLKLESQAAQANVENCAYIRLFFHAVHNNDIGNIKEFVWKSQFRKKSK